MLADLADRYAAGLEAVEATEGWVTNVRASRPPLTLLGALGGIEAGRGSSAACVRSRWPVRWRSTSPTPTNPRSALFRRRVARARDERAAAEREEVASLVREYAERSGLPREEFARRLGTSRTRLSTYCSGRVTPSAALLLRMSRVAAMSQDAIRSRA